MTNLVQKQITYEDITFNTILLNKKIYIEFAQLCKLLKLSDSYYYKKFSNDNDLKYSFIKQFVSTESSLKQGNTNKTFIDLSYIDTFLSKLTNSFHNDNFDKIKNNLSEIINLLIKEHEIEDNNSGFEIVIDKSNTKSISFNGKNFVCVKREQDNEIYIYLRHMFAEIGFDITKNINVFYNDKEILNSLTKTVINNTNIVLLNIKAIPLIINKLVHISDKIDDLNIYKEHLCDFINNEINNKETLKIPKTYMTSIVKLLKSEEINKTLETENLLLKIELEELRQKALIYDRSFSTENFQDMKQISSVLGVGRNTLFNILRENNVLIEGGEDHNLPYQKFIDSGYFVVRRFIVNRTAGKEIKNQTLVTPKGISFINRLISRNKSLIQFSESVDKLRA